MSDDVLTKEVKTALRMRANPVIFELGACDGYHSKFILEACIGKPRMFSFEPDPRNIVKCINALTPLNIKFIPAAVGNKTGTVPFNLAHVDENGNTGSSSLSAFKDQTKIFPWCTQVGTVDVDCWTLDDFCAANGVDVIDFIWMDVQGAERMVLQGGTRMIPKTRYIHTEFEGITENRAGHCYEDSITLESLFNMLPNWEPVKVYPYDALLKNTAI